MSLRSRSRREAERIATPHRVDRKVMRGCPKVPGSWTGSGEEKDNIKCVLRLEPISREL